MQAARSATLVVADALHRPARSTLGALPGAAPGQLINPTHSLWVSLAGNSSAMPVVNLLVQFGEIAIGVCVLLSFAVRFAALMGAILTGLLCVAGWSFANGIVNEQFLYAVLSAYLAGVGVGAVWGLDGVLSRSKVLTGNPARFLVA